MSSARVCSSCTVNANLALFRVYLAPVRHQMRKHVHYRSDDRLVKNHLKFAFTCFGSSENPTPHVVPARFAMAWNELTSVVHHDSMVLMRPRKVTCKSNVKCNWFGNFGLFQLHHLLLGGHSLLDGVDTALNVANARRSARSDWALERDEV